MNSMSPGRPRVEGEREQEILDAALTVLAEVGFDNLTMDAVAREARASKATLYRRWDGKTPMIIEALLSHRGEERVPDTGNLREDLIESFCGQGGLDDPHQLDVFASVMTAVTRDEEFAAAFRRDFVGPKQRTARTVFLRARDRGEIAPDADLDLIAPALAGVVLHRTLLLGEPPSTALVTRVIDQMILPAVTRTPNQKESS
ncbi:TetR/AcrR family transcriptional regulator [Nocardioides salsibiostraticola]